ncbi:hypothetical protein VaNZ11_008258, partial [Volvox africanus]
MMGLVDGGFACGLSSAPPTDSWQIAAAAATPQVEDLRRSLGPPPQLHVLRSSQLDALRLDAELGGMLQEQLGRLFEHFSPGRAAQLEPELRALLSLLVFGFSVWAGRATPGSELLNLRYRNEYAVAARAKELVGPLGVGGPGLSLPQRIVLGLGTAVLPYAWSRLCRAAHEGDWEEPEAGAWRRVAWRGMRWCEAAFTLAAAVNSWVFLSRGDYRSLLERLVGARLVWRQAAMNRIISFEYLNRQLVWQELSEALLLLMPLVDIARWRRAALRALPRPEPVAAPAVAATASASASTAVAAAGPCPLCGSDDLLTSVVALPCRHTYCYYCLRSQTEADAGFRCPLDGVRVAAMRRGTGR